MDKLYNKLNDLGFTPTGKTPDDIVNAISKLYTDRYNSAIEDVKADPGAYGISTGVPHGTNLPVTVYAEGSGNIKVYIADSQGMIMRLAVNHSHYQGVNYSNSILIR